MARLSQAIRQFLETTDLDTRLGGDILDASDDSEIYDAENQEVTAPINSSSISENGETTLKQTSVATATPGFGTFTLVDADRPSMVTIDVSAQTDSTDPGEVNIGIDRGGTGAADTTVTGAFAGPTATGGFTQDATVTVYLEAGDQYVILNDTDPNAANAINNVVESTL